MPKKDDAKAKYTQEFFKIPDPITLGKFICELCKKSFAKGNGETNLISHLLNSHSPEYLEKYEERHPVIVKQRTIQDIYGGSDTAKRIWFWIRKVVLIPLPLISVENDVMREGLLYKGITHHTLKKYMTLLQRYIIFEKIKPELLKNIGCFGAVYDGWSHQDEHYLAIFATYLDEDGVVKTPMLSCSVGEDMDEDTISDAELGENEKKIGFTANDLFDHLMLTFHDEYDLRLPDEQGNHTIQLII